jgi:hypothetical protein
MALRDAIYLLGPLAAFATIGALAAVLRRAFGRREVHWAERRAERDERRADRDERRAGRAERRAGRDWRAGRRVGPASVLTALLAALLTRHRAGMATGWRASLLNGRRLEGGPGPLTRSASADDFGLLRPAVLAEDLASAESARRQLAGAGIRSTVAPDVDGRVRVLVFFDEVARARRVVGGPAERPE